MFEDGFWSSDEVVAVLYALGLALVYVAVGYGTAAYASKKDINDFLFIVIGGMVARMLAALGVVALLIAVFGVMESWFAITFFISYFIMLMCEIFYINHKYNTLFRQNRERIIKERQRAINI